VRRDGVIREAELELKRGIGSGRLVVAARVAPLGAHHVLLLVEDRSKAARVEEIRRDFLANVSHELKTPVGGISLLAEAVLDAHDDPEAVSRFAKRISVESARLTRLVKEIVELSRLQGADVIKEPALIDVAECALDAYERSRLLAEESRIDLVTAFDDGCQVWGDAELITTAISNLIGNAIAYSESHTRVSVSVRRVRQNIIDISVTDQGLGIAPEEQERIFERFYRVDTARSRATGGTGLGLAIVKHVADNHGGNVSVWSELGRGSTFTIELPAATAEDPPRAGRDSDLRITKVRVAEVPDGADPMGPETRAGDAALAETALAEPVVPDGHGREARTPANSDDPDASDSPERPQSPESAVAHSVPTDRASEAGTSPSVPA
jgi:two-component system sensor histidine kinase SenX3